MSYNTDDEVTKKYLLPSGVAIHPFVRTAMDFAEIAAKVCATLDEVHLKKEVSYRTECHCLASDDCDGTHCSGSTVEVVSTWRSKITFQDLEVAMISVINNGNFTRNDVSYFVLIFFLHVNSSELIHQAVISKLIELGYQPIDVEVDYLNRLLKFEYEMIRNEWGKWVSNSFPADRIAHLSSRIDDALKFNYRNTVQVLLTHLNLFIEYLLKVTLYPLVDITILLVDAVVAVKCLDALPILAKFIIDHNPEACACLEYANYTTLTNKIVQALNNSQYKCPVDISAKLKQSYAAYCDKHFATLSKEKISKVDPAYGLPVLLGKLASDDIKLIQKAVEILQQMAVDTNQWTPILRGSLGSNKMKVIEGVAAILRNIPSPDLADALHIADQRVSQLKQDEEKQRKQQKIDVLVFYLTTQARFHGSYKDDDRYFLEESIENIKQLAKFDYPDIAMVVSKWKKDMYVAFKQGRSCCCCCGFWQRDYSEYEDCIKEADDIVAEFQRRMGQTPEKVTKS